MSFFKRVLMFSLIILLVLSVYKDLTKDVSSSSEQVPSPKVTEHNKNYSIVKVKVESGETVLSIIEDLNEHHIDHVDMHQLITDFKKNNPQADPYHLTVDTYYYFPLYDH